MRWIKASERVPNFEPTHLVHLRFSTDKTKFSLTGYYKNGQWYRQYGEDNVLDWAPNLEWLDESLPASIEDEAEKLYPYHPQNDEMYTDSMVTNIQRSAHITCARMYLSRLAEKDGEIEGLKAELQAIKEEHDFRNKPLM